MHKQQSCPASAMNTSFLDCTLQFYSLQRTTGGVGIHSARAARPPLAPWAFTHVCIYTYTHDASLLHFNAYMWAQIESNIV